MCIKHFVINVAFCNKIVAFCNDCGIYNKTVAFCTKKPDAFCKKVLSHFLLKCLSHFVRISVAFCYKVS